MTFLLTLLLSCLAGAVWWAVALQRALTYAYKYAARRADDLSPLDPAGRAYSDMATVLVLCTEEGGRRLIDAESATTDHPERP